MKQKTKNFIDSIFKRQREEDSDSPNSDFGQTPKSAHVRHQRKVEESTTKEIIRRKEEQNMREQKELYKKLIIKQNHPYRIKWDLFVIILALWNCFNSPVDIAYEPIYLRQAWVKVVNHIIDFFFIIDIILNFRTSY